VSDRMRLLLILTGFALCWFLPVGSDHFMAALQAGLGLVRWYAREHVLLCLVPAFFIASAITLFVSQGAVMRYLGAGARKLVAYPVAALSGTALAVCSCTVLPLFASIRQQGAGLGPATAFLYSGPAINVLAIVLTARILGIELGVARAVGAVVFAVVIGLLMQLIFRSSEAAGPEEGVMLAPEREGNREPWQEGVFFLCLVGILIFANWGRPSGAESSLWMTIYSARWVVTGVLAALLAVTLVVWFRRDELAEWVDSSWFFAQQILPLLFVGVLAAGMLLGGPETSGAGLIPADWVEGMVGGNSPGANLFAALAGALMYFATLTEVPILEGLLASGMGKGPALALLLAGPAVSLPNLLVIRSVLGSLKTLVYIVLVVSFSAAAGLLYGALF
jgi:uncharacterized membrane protein YraQ (UPF0718 family)